MTTIKKRFIVFFLLLFLLILYFISEEYINIKNNNEIPKKCLVWTKKFIDALNKQKQGLVMIRNETTNITNYDATLENIPIHFNGIWGEHFTYLNPLALKSEPSETKYFLKFNNSTSNQDCMVVTMGVGQTVNYEMELKKIYPQCNFLALDPVSEINEDLVEKKLNGTFVQRVIAAEDSYTANVRPPLIWNSAGKSEFNKSFNELSIGFFDFFEYYNSHSVIDFLSIDVDGSEFAIFQLLAEQYDQLTVIICQFNIEIHHTPGLANFFLRYRFFRNFDTFIRHSRFVLMKTELFNMTLAPINGIYHRMFFVNYVDKICVEKFLC